MSLWTKKGLILKPDPSLPWMQSHAMLPTPEHIEGSVWKIYFGGRNKLNQSNIGWALIDLDKPDQILELCKTPVLTPGRLGTFDDNGVLPSCIINHDGTKFLFFIGFKPGGTTRMDLYGGLAISEDEGKTFERWSEAPILERSRPNPFINTAPWVVPAPQGKSWLMYYVSGIEWVHKDLPRYNIQIAFSDDLKNWIRNGNVAIDFAPGENALARPYVVKTPEGYRMWFSAKGDFYLPYTAISKDGINWVREGRVNIDVSKSPAPDEEMICYPIVLTHKGREIMYYNGNAYGRDGLCLGLAA